MLSTGSAARLLISHTSGIGRPAEREPLRSLPRGSSERRKGAVAVAARKRRPSAGSAGARIKSAVYSGDQEAARLLREAAVRMPGGVAVELAAGDEGRTRAEILAACIRDARMSLEASNERDVERAVRHASRASASLERDRGRDPQREGAKKRARQVARDPMHAEWMRLAACSKIEGRNELAAWIARQPTAGSPNGSPKPDTVRKYLRRNFWGRC